MATADGDHTPVSMMRRMAYMSCHHVQTFLQPCLCSDLKDLWDLKHRRFAERAHVVQPGKCRRECRTMARMCEDIVGDHDTDLAELLLANPGRATVEQQLCYDLSSACVKKPPKFSGPRPDGEDFEEIDTEELGMLRMMATMQEQGMSGNVRCCYCAVSCPQIFFFG